MDIPFAENLGNNSGISPEGDLHINFGKLAMSLMRVFVLAPKSSLTLVQNFARWVSRYAWFSYFTNEWSYGITNPNPDAGLVDWNGALSELGRVYVSLGSGRRLTGNETENVTMPAFELNSTAPIFA